MNRHKIFGINLKTAIRYLSVGVGSLVVDYLVFLMLYYVFNTGSAIAVPSGLIVGLVVNFILNKLWSFGDKDITDNIILKQAFFYIVLVLINSLFTYFLVELFRKNLNIEPKVTKLIASACTILWNYLIYQKIIFKNPKKQI